MNYRVEQAPWWLYALILQPVSAAITVGVWWLLVHAFKLDAPEWSYYLVAYMGTLTTDRIRVDRSTTR